jgi:hypothetical protein
MSTVEIVSCFLFEPHCCRLHLPRREPEQLPLLVTADRCLRVIKVSCGPKNASIPWCVLVLCVKLKTPFYVVGISVCSDG